MKIIFLGNNNNIYSIAVLKSLIDSNKHKIYVPIINQNFDDKGKKIKRLFHMFGMSYTFKRVTTILYSNVRLFLRRNGILLNGFGSLQEVINFYKINSYSCQNVNSVDSVKIAKEINPDLILVASFSQILKSSLIGVPSLGCVNVHPSLLPKYRGPVPMYWVLKNKESKTGVTVHYIDEGIDNGDIILQEEVCIEPHENIFSLEKKLMVVYVMLAKKAVELIQNRKATRTKQNESDASYQSFPTFKV